MMTMNSPAAISRFVASSTTCELYFLLTLVSRTGGEFVLIAARPSEWAPVTLHLEEGKRGGPGNHDEAGQRLYSCEQADGPLGNLIAEANRRVNHRGEVGVLGQTIGGHSDEATQRLHLNQEVVTKCKQPDLGYVCHKDQQNQDKNSTSVSMADIRQPSIESRQNLVVKADTHNDDDECGRDDYPVVCFEYDVRQLTVPRGDPEQVYVTPAGALSFVAT